MCTIINLSFTKTELSNHVYFFKQGFRVLPTQHYFTFLLFIITFISYRIPDLDRGNQTGTYEFLLMGLSEHPEQQPLLFGLFLGMYLVTVWGNLLIILAIGSDVHLHTPCTSSWPTCPSLTLVLSLQSFPRCSIILAQEVNGFLMAGA